MTGTRRWTKAAIDVATVPPGGISVDLSAGESDRRAMADRLQLQAVETCTATFALRPDPGRGTWVEGRLSARLTRRCVVTGDPMEERIDQPVECLVVVEEPAPSEDDTAEEPDYEVAPDGRVDLAELAVQLLAVTMAAYPRGPGADEALAAFGAPAANLPDKPFADLGARMGMAASADGDNGNGDKGC